MRHSLQFRCVGAFVGLLALVCFSNEVAALPANIVTPSGTVQFNAYNVDNGGGSSGATIAAQFNQTAPATNLNLEWIQTIVAGNGTIGQTLTTMDNVASPIPYLDPYKRDDNLPYYWTAPENSTVGTGELAGKMPGTLFSDVPSQNSTDNGNSISFETALVSVSPTNAMDLTWIAGFTWGYSIAGGSATINPFAALNAPSNDMVTAVTAFDGTTSYVGDGNDTMANNAGGSAGYRFVPEPNIAILILMTATFGACAGRPRRARSA